MNYRQSGSDPRDADLMDISALHQTGAVNHGASEDDFGVLDGTFDWPIPEAYKALLKQVNGIYLDSGLVLYSSEDLVERNETFEVARYAPGYLAIGDDSGGRSVLIPFSGHGVYVVDQGSMCTDDMQNIDVSLQHWVAMGCPLRGLP